MVPRGVVSSRSIFVRVYQVAIYNEVVLLLCVNMGS